MIYEEQLNDLTENKPRASAMRSVLHEVIPLDTPFTLGIFTGDICNFKCKYCAQSAKEGSLTQNQLVKSFLDMETFNIIAKSITEFPKKIKLIMISSIGEPTLNKNLPEMISILNKLGVANEYEIVTNASVLSKELSIALIDAGLTRLVVSIQGITSKKYKEICGYNMDIQELIKNLKFFYQYSRGKCSMHIKTLNIALDEGEDSLFYDMFSHICDTIFIDSVVDCFQDVNFSDIIKHRTNIIGGDIDTSCRRCCSDIFHALFVQANGDIIPCCDPPYPLFYGNIKNIGLVEAWNSTKRINFLKMHLKDKCYQNSICDKCHAPNLKNMFPEDNLDNHKEKLLKKLEEKYGD